MKKNTINKSNTLNNFVHDDPQPGYKYISNIICIFFISICIAATFSSCNDDDGGEVAPLAITEFKPASGTVGSYVIVTGTGFNETASMNTVLVNGTSAAVSNATREQLMITIPQGAATGKITVTSGEQTVTSANNFTVMAPAETSSLAGSEKGYGNGTGSQALFVEIFGIITDAQGNVYVSESATHRIRKITPDGEVSTFAGSGVMGHADATGEAALFSKPTGLAMDGAGNLYVADYGSHRIRKITPEAVVTTVAGTGVSGGTDGSASVAQFANPRCVAVDAQGNVYVGETYRIRKITPGGSVSTLAGGSQGYADGTGTAAKFDSVADLTLDNQGFLYVADYYNNMIRKVNVSSGEVTTVAGSGAAGFSDGLSTEATFDRPAGIAALSDGSLLIADSRNRRIRLVIPTLVVNTIAGSGSSGFTDGSGGSSAFSKPNAIAVDTQNNIYVADNYRVRKITIQQQ